MINTQLERAHQLVTLQRYKEAEAELRRILSQEPTNASALGLLSICLAEQQRLKEAHDVIKNAIGQEPDNDYLLYLQAFYYLKDDKLTEAEKFGKNALAFNPHNADYLGLLASIKLSQKDFQDALDYANRGLEADPENLQCLNTRSAALYKLDNKEEAYNTIRKALEKDPENEMTHTNVGWGLLERGDHKKALEHFREALKINPGYEFAKAGLVEALKARYFFYRIFLKYAFWIGNLKGKAQWAIIIGLYVGVRILNKLSSMDENLALILNPIIYLYFAFALSTWLINPLSNLLLRLNVYGRYALTRNEIKSSNFVGIALVIGLLGLAGYLLQPSLPFALTGLFGVGMMLPLGSMLNPDKKQSQYFLIAYTAGLTFVGVMMIYQAATLGHETIFMPIFTWGVVAYMWIANAFIIKT